MQRKPDRSPRAKKTRKKKRTSVVWENFTEAKEENRVYCDTCKQTFSPNTSTSVLQQYQNRHAMDAVQQGPSFDKQESEKYLTQCHWCTTSPRHSWNAQLRSAGYNLCNRDTIYLAIQHSHQACLLRN